MRIFSDIASFRRFLSAELPGRIVAAKRAGLEAGAALVLAEMRGEIGEYQSGDAGFEDMARLSLATLVGFGPEPELIGKIPLGYAPPDNPLLRDGGLRDSFGVSVDDTGASIGSNDPLAIWQNEGTASRGVPFRPGVTTEPGIPAREFIGRAGFRKTPEVLDAISAAILEAFTKE
jgi:hypothetical protein